jgi:hypothetical protein
MVFSYGVRSTSEVVNTHPPLKAIKTGDSFPNGKTFNRENSQPIEFSNSLAVWIADEVRKAMASPNPLFYNPPEIPDARINGELKRFIVAVYAYYHPDSCLPLIPFNELMKGIVDKDFASKLKKLRFKMLVEKGIREGTYHTYDETLSNIGIEINDYPFIDVSQIFCYRYWFFWSEEDPNDELWSLSISQGGFPSSQTYT